MTTFPVMNETYDVAIIGAGIAGLTLARLLQEHGRRCIVYDKGQQVGGRTATREVDGIMFDYGLPQWPSGTAEAMPSLRGLIRTWAREDRDGHINHSWLASPGMREVCLRMAQGINVQTGTKIEQVRSDSTYNVISTASCVDTKATWVVSTAPAPQSRALLGDAFSLLDDIHHVPCWCLMGATKKAATNWHVARDIGPFQWISREDTRPERHASPTWVAHANAGWSKKHLERDKEWVKSALTTALEEVAGPLDWTIQMTHRWRYAQVSQPIQRSFLIDSDAKHATCGDGHGGCGVITALESASALAKALLASPQRTPS